MSIFDTDDEDTGVWSSATVCRVQFPSTCVEICYDTQSDVLTAQGHFCVESKISVLADQAGQPDVRMGIR